MLEFHIYKWTASFWLERDLLQQDRTDRNITKVLWFMRPRAVVGRWNQAAIFEGVSENHAQHGKESESYVKTILTIFFNRLVHFGLFLEVRQWIKNPVAQFCSICKKQSERDDWTSVGTQLVSYLHHDNTVTHIVLSGHKCPTKDATPVAPKPPYSPDLLPADFAVLQRHWYRCITAGEYCFEGDKV